MKVFLNKAEFYKANFHTHTTVSDGAETPESCMQMYADAGYKILAITDHRRVTQCQDPPDGLLMVPGIELDYLLKTQAVHVLGLGITREVQEKWDPHGEPQQAIDCIRKCGGIAVLAHPAWSLNTTEYISRLTGLSAVEIWNSVSDIPLNARRADASSFLDVLFASTGKLMPVMGNDDTHLYRSDFASGATMVQPAKFTVAGVLDAVKKGRIYASQGPRFYQIERIGNTINVQCSPVESIIFYSACVYVDGRARLGHNMTEASYRIMQMDRFIRIEITDKYGKRAWSSPINVSV